MAVRPRFDPKRPLVAARDFTFMGVAYKPGDPFTPEGANDRLRARQYEARAVNYGESEAAEDQSPVKMTESETKHTYLITAPWLDEPVRVRGVKNAEKRKAEIEAEGAPLGYIEGGSDVTVEGGDGGWYEVNAPWLDEPEKVKGREAAESRQRELHDAGAPAEGTETGSEESTETTPSETGGGNSEETTMTENRKTDTSPNEPGTNEPNGAEVINDQNNAEANRTDADSDGKDGDDGEGGDGSTGTVGP